MIRLSQGEFFVVGAADAGVIESQLRLISAEGAQMRWRRDLLVAEREVRESLPK